MSALARFAAGLASTEADAAPFGVAPDGAPSAKRFAVYRNNAASTLIEVLGDNFPLCRALVGERFFDAMADLYRHEHPPRSPILFRYGEAFPDFAQAFPPAASVPYLADLARLEWAWLRAFHAADAVPISADALAACEPDALGVLRFEFHPAVAIMRSAFPVVSIAARLRADDGLEGLDLSVPEDALVTRPVHVTELRQLPAGGFEFVSALKSGSLGEAAEAASRVAGFDLPANIAGIFSAGAVIELDS